MSRLDAALEQIQRWDERLSLRLNRALRFRVLRVALRAVSSLGDGIFWYALMLALLLGRDDAVLPVLHMIGVGLVCSAVYKLLKHGVLRPRPYQVMQSVAPGASPLDTFSFPSGHTLHAVAFTIVVIFHYPVFYALLVPFTLLTACSRVMLGLHYPSDVLAGAVLGALIGAASLALT